MQVVTDGEWLYDGSVPTAVRVVRLDYDFWFSVAEADGDLMPNERPLLNGDGAAYYLRYKPGWSEGEHFWPDSVGYMTADEGEARSRTEVARRRPMAVGTSGYVPLLVTPQDDVLCQP